MATSRPPAWAFARRLRRGAYGWRSAPAVKSVKAAVREILTVARKDPVHAAEGAVLFLERVSPAIEGVDSSSGSIGTAVRRGVEDLVAVLEKADVDAERRQGWLERLWAAFEADQIPYIERLGDCWGEICASQGLGSVWADRLLEQTRWALLHDGVEWRFFKGSTACLSALHAAGRHEEILEVVARTGFWPYRRWAVKALASLGRKAEAIALAEETPGADARDVAQLCEEMYLSSGMREEAYRRYALAAHQGTTYLATFRSVRKAYPEKEAAEVLEDLAASTPGEEGKWFAAAKSAGLRAQALELARRGPCDPRTLARAARDFAKKDPPFAVEAGLLALIGMVRGDAYELDCVDVLAAHDATMEAARLSGADGAASEEVRRILLRPGPHREFVARCLGPLERRDPEI